MRIRPNAAKDSGFSLIEVMVAMTIMLIIVGVAFTSVTRLMQFSEIADREMLVSTENQRGMIEIRNGLNCSSRNCVGQYGPEVVGGELRFRVCNGFDDDTASASFGSSTYSDYQVCYYHNADNNTLVRRFYNADADLLTIDANGYLLNPPPEYPMSASSHVISHYCTDASFDINVDAGMVTITLTNSIGAVGSIKYTIYTKEFTVFPFNHD